MNLANLGSVIAIIVLVVDLVLVVIGRPPGGIDVAGLIAGLAIARLT